MRILAFDQATKVTGWAYIDSGSPIEYGHIVEVQTNTPAERIHMMFLEIAHLIELFHPDLVVVEGVQHQANAKTMLMLSQLQGMCIGKAYLENIPVYSPLPVEWRKILDYKQGPHEKRADLKAQSVAYVQGHFNITATEDECEAICIGIAANQIYQK